MYKAVIAATLAVSFLSACAVPYKEEPIRQRPLGPLVGFGLQHPERDRTVGAREANSLEFDAIKDGILSVLRDPGSLHIQDVVVGLDIDQGARETIACARINAKNGYGGYVGLKPIMGVLKLEPNDRLRFEWRQTESRYGDLAVTTCATPFAAAGFKQ